MRAMTSIGIHVHPHPQDGAGHGSHSEGNSPPHVNTPSSCHAFYAVRSSADPSADRGMSVHAAVMPAAKSGARKKVPGLIRQAQVRGFYRREARGSPVLLNVKQGPASSPVSLTAGSQRAVTAMVPWSLWTAWEHCRCASAASVVGEG